MIKKIIFSFLFFTIIGCDSEGASDCIQSSGDIIQQDIEVTRFNKIIVWDGIKLFIKQGDTQSVVVETGENLLNEISVSVFDNLLEIRNGNTCNLVRDYGITKVYVTTPELSEIRNSSGLAVESQGLISFRELLLISDDPDNLGEYQNDGDFIMDSLNIRTLRVTANGLATFFLKGKAFNCHLGAADSDVRIEAQDLEIQHLYLFHRSTNKMIVSPQQSIRGKILGLGDVISLHQPPIVEVEEFYTGRLIFE